jgi:hypothetical protein
LRTHRAGIDGSSAAVNGAVMDSAELLERVRACASGRAPKEIARALGLRLAQAAPLVRTIATEDHAGASERKPAGCWVSPGWSSP